MFFSLKSVVVKAV